LYHLFQSFSVVDEKDRAAKYVRVIAASLQALGKFLKMVDQDTCDQTAHFHANLTTAKKFWKFGRHKSPQVCIKVLYSSHPNVNKVQPI
jgi:hypothetical protein